MLRRIHSFLLTIALASTLAAAEFHEIQVVDDVTGRGVPLVELSTVNRVSYWTDSAGRVAFGEPGLLRKEVFLAVRSHGYEFPKDGFGSAGTRVKTEPGKRTILKIKRKNIAERLYRITGEGIYRDTILLGHSAPIQQPLLNSGVVGQDSTQAAIYDGQAFFGWGDTAHHNYPLGNFRASGATAKLPRSGGLQPDVGVDLAYFSSQNGYSKQLCRFEPKDGVVWLDGLVTIKDEAEREQLVARFTRLKGLGSPLEHGIVAWNNDHKEFERAATFKMDEYWRAPTGQAFKHRDRDIEYIYFARPLPNLRVRATYADVLKPSAYEAFSCLQDGSETSTNKAKLLRDADGKLQYRWTTHAPPTGPAEEAAFIEAGLMKRDEARFLVHDAESDAAIRLQSGSVRWNPWRKRWIAIAVQQFGSSFLGEVWYAESDSLTGPWKKARKIVTHDRYSFYNPVHHDFYDQDGGRTIYFEGTYTDQFSGAPMATPHYDYNQIMYRIDLADERLKAAQN